MPLTAFENYHCNLNGTKAALEALVRFLFSGFLLLQLRSEQSLRKVTKLSGCGGGKSSCFERVTFTK
jgi:hypothetical protein